MGGDEMTFREHDKKTFIINAANAFTERRITKRQFLSRMGTAGIGFSAFAAGLLGNPPSPRRGGLSGTPAEAQTRDEMNKWLKDVGSYFKGATVRYTSE